MRSSAFPPRTTDTAPVSSCRSTRASRACSDRRRTALACRSAAVPYPRILPDFSPAWTASRAWIRPDAGLQAGPAGAQVLPGQPDLVLAGPGDRPGPPGRRPGGQRPLPDRPGPRPAPRVQRAPQRTGRQGPSRPATPGARPPPAAPPRPPARGAAGPVPARLPGPPPRTARQPGAGNQSPARLIGRAADQREHIRNSHSS